MSARRRKPSSTPTRLGPGYELADKEKDRISEGLYGDPANLLVHDPGEKQRVPAGGAWAMVTRQLPPVEGGVDRNMRVGRVFYVEHLSNADSAGFLPDGSYRVLCRSPWGDVCLWPYEYSVFPAVDLTELWAVGELIFHPLHIDDARFSQVVFYARSRGIGLADAAVMALGTLSGPVGWFEPRPDLAEACEAMERRVHRPWPVLRRMRKVVEREIAL